MDKIKNFLNKNYDYYTIITLTLISFLLNIGSIFSTLFSYLPCFMGGLDRFILRATYYSAYKLRINPVILDNIFPGYGILINVLLENLIGIMILFGLYFIGKKVCLKYSKKFNTLFFILFFIYWMNILFALTISIVERCLLRIS